ncbi:uncharacterized protein LOC125661001 [Ostrea edulis]|uniref:uncharacterized protein LOC125661001 n=1 Tax=Ostrea edulis TaxID=37623 RepID=UPI0024AED414|nr:uncharacterized protein LOC125661001 [Ostrea edulis]
MAERSMFSKEERNFWILDVLIKHVAPPAVRKQFDVIVPPNDLANVLNNNAKILQMLFSKKVINVYQQDVLLRVPGVKIPTISAVSTSGKKAASSEDFDLTLMICLLRNLNLVSEPATGWDQVPPHSDNSLGANMTRIKVYRNKLAHPSKNRMRDHSFKKIWASLKKALSEISEGETDEKVREIETFDFDGSNREQLLCKIQQGLHEMQNELQFHRNLKENTTNVLKEWKSELEVFYRTRGTAEVLERIRTNNTVMIIGNSGAGKSTTMKYVSLLLEEEGYEIIPVSSANDIPFQRFSDRRQIFVIDDIFGKYRVDSVIFETWRRLNDRLKVIFRDKNAKLLCTLRRQLQNDISHFLYETIFDTTVVDLDSSDLTLSEIEKKGMFEKHLLHQNIKMQFDEVSLRKICSCKYAFPLMCRLYSSNSDFLKRKANFFSSPSEILKEEFYHLQKENNEVYCVLVLVVIFHPEELKNIFDITCEINRKDDYSLVLEACGVGEFISRTSLYNQLLSLTGVFVGLDNPFTFIHDNIEDTVAFHFGSCFPKVMFQCCKRTFLRERIRITRHEIDDENVLVIKRSSYDDLSQRLLKEIINGKFHDILLSEPLQNRGFVHYFVSHIEKNGISLNHLESILCTEMLLPSYLQVGKNLRDITNINREALTEILQSSKCRFIYWVAATGSHLLFHHIFERQKGIARELYESYTLINDLLHIAVLGGSIDIIKSLIERGANVNSFDKYGTPLLCKIAGTKRCDIAKLLLEEGVYINQVDEVLGWTACHVASWFNHVEMLKLLLSRGATVNEFDFKSRVPLVLAVQKNNEQSVSVLLSYGAYAPDEYLIFATPFTSDDLLGEALHNKNSEIIQMLLNSGKVVNSIGVSFPLSFLEKGVVKERLALFLKSITGRANNSRARLWGDFVNVCDAICKNDIHMIHKIFNKIKKMNRYSAVRGIHVNDKREVSLANFHQNYLLFTPLHISAVCDNFIAAKALMSYGANPFQKDAHGRTALHFANSRAMIKVLLSTRTTTTLTNMSSQSVLQNVITYIIAFKFVPMIFSSFMNTNVNIKDKVGNTPLHSIVVRSTNVTKCLDAVETLIEHGANPCIRCRRGNLPIDHFRTVSPLLEECDIERGERILGCNKTKSYIKKEKCYSICWTFLSVACYLWLSFFGAKRVCYGRGSGISANDSRESGLFQFRYMFYSQVIFLIILHLIYLPSEIMIQSLFVRMGSMPIRSDIYSKKQLLSISSNIAIAMVTIRVLFYHGISSNTGQTVFNLYCVWVCTMLLVIYFPFPVIRKHQSLLLTVFKVTLVSFLMGMILAPFLSSSIESKSTCNLDHQHWSFIDFYRFLIAKIFVSFFCIFLFISKLANQLFHSLLEPVYWYRHVCCFLLYRWILLFFIIEILTLPVTIVICNIENC